MNYHLEYLTNEWGDAKQHSQYITTDGWGEMVLSLDIAYFFATTVRNLLDTSEFVIECIL